MEATLSIKLLQSQLDKIDENSSLLKRFIDTVNQSVWLTDKELAARWKMSVSTLNKWRINYNIPCSQIGDIRRYQAKVVDEWLAKFSSEGIISLKHKLAA